MLLIRDQKEKSGTNSIDLRVRSKRRVLSTAVHEKKGTALVTLRLSFLEGVFHINPSVLLTLPDRTFLRKI